MEENKPLKNLNLRQSERTTFNLTEKAYEILELCANAYQISQKDIFSIIIEDAEWFEQIIKKIRNQEIDFNDKKTKKTKVISKGALERLNARIRSENFSRDLVLEIALRELNEHLTNKVESHEKAKKIVDQTRDQIETVGIELGKLLEDGDPIIIRWGFVTGMADNLSSAINNELNNGTPIDPDDWTQS